MKKFRFSLDTVLEYRRQIFDALMGEHTVLLARVREQERVRDAARGEYARINAEYRSKQTLGMTVAEARGYETGLWVAEQEVQRQSRTLQQLQRQSEAKRQEMVAAKQDVSAIEKLREKRLADYNYESQRDEEKFIDDLVCARGTRQP